MTRLGPCLADTAAFAAALLARFLALFGAWPAQGGPTLLIGPPWIDPEAATHRLGRRSRP